MILTRQGNKRNIADKIQSYFPSHNTFVELFFGAGGMFFNKPISKNNICNDIDSDVMNFWEQIKFNKENFISELKQLPIHTDLWAKYKKENIENKTLKAVLFLMYSNFGYMGKPDSLGFSASCNYKDTVLKNIDKTFDKIKDVLFMNDDFRNVLPKIKFRSDNEKANTFIYADPVYLGTYNYKKQWDETDTIDCMDITFNSGFKGAMSEFDNEFVLKQAKERNLNIYTIGERQNMKNRKTEILITNYKNNPSLFDGLH